MAIEKEFKILVPLKPIDIKALQSAKEIQIYEELKKNENLMSFFDAKISSESPYQVKRSLLSHAMRITNRMSPMLTELLDVVLKIVKVDFDVEIFVSASPDLNAKSMYDEKDNRTYILLTSALLERLNQTELLFIIGHEIAHQVYKHTRFNVQLAMSEGRGTLIPLTILKLLSWQRYAEITCDRIGLLCCQNFNAAATTFFKLTSGVTTGKLDFQIEDYLKQLEEISSLENLDDYPEDWFNDHPFSPLRIKALELFSNSDIYNNALKIEKDTIEFINVENSIEDFMKIMEPSYLTNEEDVSSKIKDWLAYSALMVALANGEIVPEEISKITELVGMDKSKFLLEEADKIDIDQIFEKVKELGEAVWVTAKPPHRLQMLRDLVLIAAADGTIDEHEYYALCDLAAMIDVNSSFVDGVIEEMSFEVSESKQPADQKIFDMLKEAKSEQKTEDADEKPEPEIDSETPIHSETAINDQNNSEEIDDIVSTEMVDLEETQIMQRPVTAGAEIPDEIPETLETEEIPEQLTKMKNDNLEELSELDKENTPENIEESNSVIYNEDTETAAPETIVLDENAEIPEPEIDADTKVPEPTDDSMIETDIPAEAQESEIEEVDDVPKTIIESTAKAVETDKFEITPETILESEKTEVPDPEFTEKPEIEEEKAEESRIEESTRIPDPFAEPVSEISAKESEESEEGEELEPEIDFDELMKKAAMEVEEYETRKFIKNDIQQDIETKPEDEISE